MATVLDSRWFARCLLLIVAGVTVVSGHTCSGKVPSDLAEGRYVLRHFQQRDPDPRLGTYKRIYAVALPEGYDGTTRFPLLMYFHAWGGDTSEFSPKFLSKHGYVVVSPQGMADDGLSSWDVGTANHTDTCSAAVVSEYHYKSCTMTGATSICNSGTCYDDFSFLANLITSLSIDLCLDANQIYLSGASFGAIFNYYAAAELSHRAGIHFRAILPWYGAFYQHTQRIPKHPVSVFHFHGLLDDEVPPGGGMGGDGYLYIPVEQTLNEYASAYGCEARPTAISTPFDGRGTLVGCKEWRNCKHGVQVVRCNWHEGHHFWPEYAYSMMRWFMTDLVQRKSAAARTSATPILL